MSYEIVTSTQQALPYTLQASDAGAVVEITGSGNLTVPAGFAPVGACVEVYAFFCPSPVLVAGASGVTVRVPAGFSGKVPGSGTAWLRQRATNDWVLSGACNG